MVILKLRSTLVDSRTFWKLLRRRKQCRRLSTLLHSSPLGLPMDLLLMRIKYDSCNEFCFVVFDLIFILILIWS